jgi:hypothetical protein
MNEKIKVTPDQLKQIISEETVRFKKVLELQRKREAILSQLKDISESEKASKDKEKPHAVDGGEPIEGKPEPEPQTKKTDNKK